MWFALSNAIQNGMIQLSSTNNHGGDRLKGKGLYAGPVLSDGDWALVLPTPKLASTSLQSPEKFVQMNPSIQKLVMIFQNTDAQSNQITQSVLFRMKEVELTITQI